MNRRTHGKPHDGQAHPEEAPSQAEELLLDPYETLGLSRRATAEAIKKAYFAKVREYPPEREQAMFKKIRAAYDALRTPEAKAATDLFLLHPPAPHVPLKRHGEFDLSFHIEDWQVLAAASSDLGRVDFREDYRDIKL